MSNDIVITAFGNPNVDITVKVNDTYFFDKYQLTEDGQAALSEDTLGAIKDDIKRLKLEIIRTPGGCAQNTLRVFQWLSGVNWQTAMFGSTGTDSEADYLETEMNNAGVITKYVRLPNVPTSSVIVFIRGQTRTAAYTDEGASTYFLNEHLYCSPEPVDYIKRSRIVHLEAFFTLHSPDVGHSVYDICRQNFIIRSFNISGEYVREQFGKYVSPFAIECDILIGNRLEFLAMCKYLQTPTDNVDNMLMSFHRMKQNTRGDMKHAEYQAQNQDNDRYKNIERFIGDYGAITVMTDGDKPVRCVSDKDERIVVYEVPPIYNVVDTNGAGDSFLAGFLWAVNRCMPLRDCMAIGCETAASMIQQLGCTVPKSSAKFLSKWR